MADRMHCADLDGDADLQTTSVDGFDRLNLEIDLKHIIDTLPPLSYLHFTTT